MIAVSMGCRYFLSGVMRHAVVFLIPDLGRVCILDAVEVSPLRSSSIFPEEIPVVVDVNGPQAHHAFRSLDRPTHSREFQSVVDEVATCAFNDPATDGVALCQADFVPHVFAGQT